MSQFKTEDFGYRLMKGAIQAIGIWVAGPAFLLSLVWIGLGFGMDDSDTSRWKRSGVEIVTDAKTGLQYLRASGGLTPRMTLDGQHMRAGER